MPVMLKIGPVELETNLLLAPIAGTLSFLGDVRPMRTSAYMCSFRVVALTT